MQLLVSKIKRAKKLGMQIVFLELCRRTFKLVNKRYRYWRTYFYKTSISKKQLEKTIPKLNSSKWLEHFKTRSNPQIFPGLRDLIQTAQVIKTQCPKAVETTLAAADAICEHNFYYFDQEFNHSKEYVNWHFEWPNSHYTKIIYGAQLKPSKDIKIAWELGRFLHANILGRAYTLTQNEQYAKEFFTQLESFDKKNPCEFGPHWLCAMEVAIRAVNLIIGYYFFRGSEFFTDAQVERLLRMLYEHASYIEKNLENAHHLTSNHYIADLVGLLFIGVLFPEFDSSKRWRNFAWQELLIELDKQIYPDGTNWEASIGYHRLVTELFAYSFWIGANNGLKLPNKITTSTLVKMFDFANAYLRPDGIAPQIGDNDNGQLFTWAERLPTDHSYLLPIKTTFCRNLISNEPTTTQYNNWNEIFTFRENVFAATSKKLSAPEIEAEAIWLSGKVPSLNIFTEQTSKGFADSGIYIMRKDNNYLIVDCGDNGIGGQGSHGHNDALSFELWSNGTAWLIDPGTHTYTGDLESRNLFRSTSYHNTASIDGQEISPIIKTAPFSLGTNVKPIVTAWESNSDRDILEAEHNGFRQQSCLFKHKRKIVFDKKITRWKVEDSFLSTSQNEEKHTIELFFNFGLGVHIIKSTLPKMEFGDDKGNKLIIEIVELHNQFTSNLLERWVSNCYGHRALSFGISLKTEVKLPVVIRWHISFE